MPTETTRVLLVERSPGDALGLQRLLTDSAGVRLEAVVPHTECAAYVARHAVDVVLLDLGHPERSGLDTLATVLDACPDLPVLALSATDEEGAGDEAVRMGAQDCLNKGRQTPGAVGRAIRFAVTRKQAERNLRRSEERLRLVLSSTRDGWWDWDLTTDTYFASPRWWEMLGYEPGELPLERETQRRLTHPDDLEGIERAFQAALGSGSATFEVEVRRRHQQGHWVPVRTRAHITRDAAGKALRVTGSTEDISEQREAQEALRKSEARFRAIYEQSPFAYHSLDAEGRILDVNPAWERLFGYARQEVIGAPLTQFACPASVTRAQNQFAAFRENGSIHGFELEAVNRAGEKLVVVMEGVFVRDEHGAPHHTHCVVHDITARKIAEDALREREGLLRRAVEVARLGSWRAEAGGGILWSPRMYEMHRISPTAFEPTHENFLTLIHPDDRSAFSEWISAQVAGVATGPIEFRAVTPDGVVRWIRTIAEREGDEHGDFVALSGAAQDITDSKLATDALARSESKWRHVLASVPQIGISLDVEGRIIFANAYFLALTGWEEGEVLGRDWFDTCIPEGSREEIRGVFALAMADRNGLGVTSYENPIITRSGELREVAWSNVLTRGSDGGIVDVTCLGVDITERRRAQDEAARKLEELQRWRQATLGREGRILELKREVNTLCDKLGLPHPYASADAISNDGAR